MVGEGKKSRYTPIKLREKKTSFLYFYTKMAIWQWNLHSTFARKVALDVKNPYQIFDLLDKNLDCISGCKNYSSN